MIFENIIAGNVAIVDSQSECFQAINSSVQESIDYSNETVSLPIVSSEAVLEDSTSIILLFGSWVECGDEDNKLDELYRQRTFR